jgi:acyl-CoA thioester hydrolase
MAFQHRIRIRYQEVDMQRVVFNAHYLAYLDDTMAAWLSDAFGWSGDDDHFDWMLVKVLVEWQGSCTYGDTLEIEAAIARWGNTSFDVGFVGTVGDRPVFTATITYVCVQPGTTDKMPVPPDVKDALA